MTQGGRRYPAVLGALLLAVLLGGCAVKPVVPGPPPPTPSALDLIGQRGELRVCSTGDYRPFTYRDRGGNWSGIDVDMARNMAVALNVRLTLVPTAWDKLTDGLTAGRCDLAMGGISVTATRARQAAYTSWTAVDGKAALVRCGQVKQFGGLPAIDRPGVRVVVNPGGTNADYDRRTLHQATVVRYPDNNTITDQLLHGQADVMITDASEARWQAARHPGQLCAVNPEHPFTFEPKAYLMPRGDVVLQQWVNTWLGLTLGDGTYQRLSQPWWNPAARPAPVSTRSSTRTSTASAEQPRR